ncbi:MAG: sigma-54-dependent Fis family transcriptional regulator [Myxococcales bacterium]|nr:sigma-54-dependent Fis family transcriptional regulator [Myxococcales bacterium]
MFLDEVGELSASAQAKVLRALETKRITRLGAQRERAIDIRIVAATHRDLRVESEAGRFRHDLYFRLGAATVVLPPLRDRPRDLPILARLFLERACTRAARSPLTLAPATMRALATYRWPGNVRELKNLMEYLAAAVVEGTVEPQALPATIAGPAPSPSPPPPPLRTMDGTALPPLAGFVNVADEIRLLERTRMAAALESAAGNQSRAAELIGMPRRTFVTKLKEYGLLPRK